MPRLISKNNVFYPIAKRSNTAYLRINAYCSYCKKNDTKAGKYTITVPKCPERNHDVTSVFVDYTDHNHSSLIDSSSPSSSPTYSSDSDSASSSSKSNSNRVKIVTFHQITGSERINTAKEILANHGGSATKYRLHLISQTENSDQIINIASVEVYKKILQEYNNRDDISTNWQQNLKASASTFLASIRGKKIHGKKLFFSSKISILYFNVFQT